ncbi:unnamed protein product [Lactuca virosa]|uniref:Uncharacterized protein n=1 Tax=Lactuca virosa TaxID=75947 RepID=A0AAU9M9M0_9ASTR|nr:unnamed protein product [Lactuca virosa]
MIHSTDKVILFCMHALLYLCSSEGKINKQEIVSVSAVLTFGDSFVDQGNNNYIPAIGKANYLPYAKDFMGGKPTGRFSNGKTLADFYGLENTNSGCCGTGLVEVVYLCNKFGRTCPDDSKFLFWDSIHLSEIGCNIFANESLPGLVDSLL